MAADNGGSLLGRFFQLGYVARDVDAAKVLFQERFGPAQFETMSYDADMPVRHVAIGYLGAVMFEIIEPNMDIPTIYTDSLPKTSSDIRLHHLGHLVDDFSDTLSRVEALGYYVPFQSTSDELDCCYVDTRTQLGHYLEYVRIGEQWRAKFASLPGCTAAGKLGLTTPG